ncbi:MAG: trypsin-like peptidase domain-containing protein [Bacteroidales bacterium]|nr:trypsin-like peptidase domain-containing protein [Bacteroidales bacterium]
MKNKRYILFIIIPVLLISLPCKGQISFSGMPAGADFRNVPFIKLPGVNRDKLISIEEQERLITGKKSLRFGKIIPVSLGIDNAGVFQSFEGCQVWRIGLWSPDARGLGLIFDRFDLDDGEKVFIYSPDKKQVLGAFTGGNMNKNKTLAIRPLPNDSIIIEFQFKENRENSLHIGSVVYDYRGINRIINSKDEWYNTSGPCNVDINCPEGQDWQSEKNAVCREFIYKADHGYSELCTGVLISNTSETDTPYLLTSNHCIEDTSHAENTIFVFQYESPECDGPDGSVAKSISGSELKATSENLDFTLVELNEIPPITYNPIYAGWSNLDIPPENSVTIHHPNGDVKKISVDNDPAVVTSYSTFDENAFWNILQWDVGTTEAGSSGAPLFDQDHKVVGVLSGGDAHCGNSVNDYFLRLTDAWDDYSSSGEQLKYWLDPENSGATSVNHRDPYLAVEINNYSDIVVYPNPASGLVSFIQNKFSPGAIRVQVYHPAGYILQDVEMEFTGSRIDLDLTGLKTGLYFIRISQGAKNETFKVSIVR